jgi:hypothetical protein
MHAVLPSSIQRREPREVRLCGCGIASVRPGGTGKVSPRRVAQCEETGVTTLLLSCRSADEIRSVAALLT